jgi:hypothetical protein
MTRALTLAFPVALLLGSTVAAQDDETERKILELQKRFDKRLEELEREKERIRKEFARELDRLRKPKKRGFSDLLRRLKGFFEEKRILDRFLEGLERHLRRFNERRRNKPSEREFRPPEDPERIVEWLRFFERLFRDR